MNKLALVLLFLFPLSAFAADVTRDNDDSVACGGDPCTLSSFVVASQANRLLVVWFGQNSGTSISGGCTFNGDAMTFISGLANGSATMWLDMYQLVAPDVATGDIVCDLTSTVGTAIGAISVYNVNQADPLDDEHMGEFGGVAQDPISTSTDASAGDMVLLGAAVRSQTCADTQTGELILFDDVNIGGSTRLLCAVAKVGPATDAAVDLSAAAQIVYGSMVAKSATASIVPTLTYRRTQNRRRL